MEIELLKKATSYETLISKSRLHPWSPEQLKVENAYMYYWQLCKEGNQEKAYKQFEFLKKQIEKAIFKFRRQTTIPIKKLKLSALLVGVETAAAINEIDWIIEMVLDNIGRHPHKE